MLKLTAALLLASIAPAQSLFRAAPPGIGAPFRRVLTGQFLSSLVPDVAVLAGDRLWVVIRPKTWGTFYATDFTGLADIAWLPRTSLSPHDFILGVGGGNPRLLSCFGGSAVVTTATDWQQVTRVQTATHLSFRRAVGLDADATHLRFATVNVGSATLATQDVREFASPVLDLTFANWDHDLSRPEAIVVTASGLYVFDWNGGPPRAVVSRPAAQGHLARLRTPDGEHLAWAHRAVASGPWTLEVWYGGVEPLYAAPLSFQGLMPDDVDIVNLAGADVDGVVPQNMTDDLLVHHRTEGEGEGEGGMPDAVVLRYRPLETPLFLAAARQSAAAPSAADACRMVFTDVDGDFRAETIRATNGAPGLAFEPPPSSRLVTHEALAGFADDLVNGFQVVNLRFAVDPDCWIRVTAWHQPSLDVNVRPVAALTEGTMIGEYYIATLPFHTLTNPGIFYLEIDFFESSGEVTSMIYPYIPNQVGFVELNGYVDQGIVTPGDEINADNREVSVVKRPIYYKIQAPPDDPPIQ